MTLIAPALPKDSAELAALVNSAYRGEPSRIGWSTEADYLDGQRTDAALLADELVRENQVILTLRETENGPMRGCVLLQRRSQQECYLGMLTIQPELQARGFGRILLTEAEDFARWWGCSWMSLRVLHPRAEMMAWYERRGYLKTGNVEPYPYGDLRLGIPLRPDLEFAVFRKALDCSGWRTPS